MLVVYWRSKYGITTTVIHTIFIINDLSLLVDFSCAPNIYSNNTLDTSSMYLQQVQLLPKYFGFGCISTCSNACTDKTYSQLSVLEHQKRVWKYLKVWGGILVVDNWKCKKAGL